MSSNPLDALREKLAIIRKYPRNMYCGNCYRPADMTRKGDSCCCHDEVIASCVAEVQVEKLIRLWEGKDW